MAYSPPKDVEKKTNLLILLERGLGDETWAQGN